MNTAEKLIVRYTVKCLIADCYKLAIEDEGGEVGPLLADTEQIVAALGAMEDERVYAHRGGKCAGWVRFIYGNGNNGFDVVCDYTTSLEQQMGHVSAYVDGLEAMRDVLLSVFE